MEHRGIVQTTHHGWVADTGDSGLAPFMTQIQQCELAAYTKGSAQEVVNFVHDNGGEGAKPAGPEGRCKVSSLLTTFLPHTENGTHDVITAV
jgi:hypothetical protein